MEPKLNSENGPNNEIIDKQVNCAPQVNKIGQVFNSNILKRKRNESNSVTEQKSHSAGYQLKNKKPRSVKVTSSHVGNVRVTPNEEGEGGQTELVVKPVECVRIISSSEKDQVLSTPGQNMIESTPEK